MLPNWVAVIAVWLIGMTRQSSRNAGPTLYYNAVHSDTVKPSAPEWGGVRWSGVECLAVVALAAGFTWLLGPVTASEIYQVLTKSGNIKAESPSINVLEKIIEADKRFLSSK